MSDDRTLFFGPVLHLDDVLLFHLERLRGVILLDWSSIEKESEVVDCYPGSLAVGVLYFLQLCCRRNDEVNLDTAHLTNDLQSEMNRIFQYSAISFHSRYYFRYNIRKGKLPYGE